MTAARRRLVRQVAAAATCAGLLVTTTGCFLDVQHLPVGSQVGGPTYHLTAVFANAARLPANAQVKVDGVLVGRVTGVTAQDYRAHVGFTVKQGVKLPQGTRAKLRMTTPLGEEYVELIRPAGPAHGGVLHDGETIGVGDTSTAPDVENVLSALAQVLNGSGLDQVRTIVTELNTALTGNDAQTRDLLERLTRAVATLDAHTADIDRLLTNLDKLSGVLVDNRSTIATALQQIAPAAQVLAANTDEFTTLMQRLSDLGTVSQHVVASAKADLLATLQNLQRPLDVLAGLRDQLPATLSDLAAFESVLSRAIPADYLNVSGVLSLTPNVELTTPVSPSPGPLPLPLPSSPLQGLLSGGLR